jgi:hypothetical protein
MWSFLKFRARPPAPASTGLQLAGFTLAHAMWSVSDTAADELLCPLAFIERRGDRELVRFEADSQTEAIARGKQVVAEATSSADVWSFAHEGIWRPASLGGAPQDVITVAFWERGMSTPTIVAQPFERADGTSTGASGRFRVLGDPKIAVEGVELDGDAAASAVRALLDGVASHDAVAPLWPAWRSSGT